MSDNQMSIEELTFVCQQFFGNDLIIYSSEPTIGFRKNQKCQTTTTQIFTLSDISHILQLKVSVFYDRIPARFTKQGKDWQAGIKNNWFKKDLTLIQIYELIRSTTFRERTEKLRGITDEVKNKKYKRSHFSYACFSGTFSKRNDSNLINHSHLICIDLDHLPDVQAVRERIKREVSLDYFVMLFTSPNGNGLKVIFHSEEITPDTQWRCYEYFADHLASLCGNLPEKCIDESCKDISRGCFLPYDPHIFLNPKLFYHDQP